MLIDPPSCRRPDRPRSRVRLLLQTIAPIDRERRPMTLIVLLAAFAVSATLGLALARGSLMLIFWSIETKPAETEDQRTVNGSMSSVRVPSPSRSEEHTSELQSRRDLVCRLLLE